MKRVTKIAIGIGAAVSLGLAAATVAAHTHGYGPGWGMGGGMGAHGHAMGPQAGAPANPASVAEGRIAFLKSELKITAGQESAWKAYADQAKQQAEAMQGWRTAMRDSTATSAPQRLEQRNQVMKQHLAQAETMASVLKDLYAVLTPEQRAVADARLAVDRGMGRGMGPGFGASGPRFR